MSSRHTTGEQSSRAIGDVDRATNELEEAKKNQPRVRICIKRSADIHEAQEVVVHILAAYDIRMSSMVASISDLQRSGSDVYQSVSGLKFELANLIDEIKAKEVIPSRSTTKKGESSNKNQRIEYVHQQSVNRSPAVHFDEQAECWYAASIKPLGRVRWNQFVVDMYARFSLTNRISVIGEFNKLVQIGSVDDYFNRFESVRAQVVQEFDYLDENYFCMSFIGGLEPEIRSRVEQFEVESLSKAIHIARKEEVAIHSLFKNHRPMQTSSTPPSQHHTTIKPSPSNFGPSPLNNPSKTILNTPILKPNPLQAIPFKPSINTYPVNPHKGLLPTPSPKPPPRTNQLSTEEHQRRITQGLCFRCGANFEPGHKNVCPMNSIAMIIAKE
ncbi:hypothetical protein RJ640_000861 [Escallonia rubra]|uniref:Ty3 transposon capsid-like protein domain-containing protein n=1 Tax=Escallonia rubra TaxID=112253 RepID=A0AA88S5I5_9ASTE|nr:hypothetical protein RJ640_000861 [Escallonia rubra]